jgi:lipopolysaccharide/colanic/teichoic acid biosynthesis glycosyltransferase
LKRLFDVFVALIGLIVASPVLLLFMLLVFLQDFHSPFYMASRVGRGGRDFTLVKLRSMTIGADRSGVDSTAQNDPRITRVGQMIRSYKLDELPQLWNVLTGKMSLVGPRPQVRRDADLYTEVEKGLLAVRPGITDLASIVFSDEGEILKDREDPDLAYNQLIRPWKSRLALANIQHSTPVLDLKLIYLTAVAILSRDKALDGVQKILADLDVDEDIRAVAARNKPLEPFPPPGASEVVQSR